MNEPRNSAGLVRMSDYSDKVRLGIATANGQRAQQSDHYETDRGRLGYHGEILTGSPAEIKPLVISISRVECCVIRPACTKVARSGRQTRQELVRHITIATTIDVSHH